MSLGILSFGSESFLPELSSDNPAIRGLPLELAALRSAHERMRWSQWEKGRKIWIAAG